MVMASCQTPSVEMQTGVDWVSQLTERPAERVPFDGHVPARGAPARPAGEPLLAGDRLLFAVDLIHGDLRQRRYLGIEVQEPVIKDGKRQVSRFSWSYGGDQQVLETDLYRVRLDLWDAEGQHLESSEVQIAEGVAQDHIAPCVGYDALAQQFGPLQAVDTESEAWTEAVRPVAEQTSKSVHSLVSLFGLAQSDSLLSKLLWDVIDKPSLWSLMRHGGVEVSLQPAYHESSPVTAAQSSFPMSGPYRSLPLAIVLNERPALYLRLLVVSPEAPWSLTGGILAFEGQHPDRDSRVLARLIDARWQVHP